MLQTASALERVAFEICEDLHLHSNVSYAEVRYCPSLHRQQGMEDDAIVSAVEAGLRKANEAYPACRFYQIITILRVSQGVFREKCPLNPFPRASLVPGLNEQATSTLTPAWYTQHPLFGARTPGLEPRSSAGGWCSC